MTSTVGVAFGFDLDVLIETLGIIGELVGFFGVFFRPIDMVLSSHERALAELVETELDARLCDCDLFGRASIGAIVNLFVQ